MGTEELLKELEDLTLKHIQAAKLFQRESKEKLNQKPNPESWSILECIEHLNRYGEFYIPEIQKRISASTSTFSDKFKSGVLGNYFAKSMLPKEKLNTMKTFKVMNPSGSKLNETVLDKFLTQQEQLLDLLKKSRNVSLTKTKTAISISKWIKLRLGDTFKVVIYHNLRHIEQAKKLL